MRGCCGTCWSPEANRYWDSVTGFPQVPLPAVHALEPTRARAFEDFSPMPNQVLLDADTGAALSFALFSEEEPNRDNRDARRAPREVASTSTTARAARSWEPPC